MSFEESIPTAPVILINRFSFSVNAFWMLLLPFIKVFVIQPRRASMMWPGYLAATRRLMGKKMFQVGHGRSDRKLDAPLDAIGKLDIEGASVSSGTGRT